MKAKDYLMQLVYLDCKIKENSERVMQLKESAENRTSNLSPNKVQSSGSKDKIGDAVTTYTVLENEIKRDEAMKQRIIDTINLLKPYESTVLYQRYAKNKYLAEIADDIKRSYSWVAKIHGIGLKKIQNILDEREKAGV